MSRDELVEKMCEAFYCPQFTRESALSAWNKKAMAAALALAVEDVLREPTKEETRSHGLSLYGHEKAIELFAARRSHYVKPKSAEDRVTVDALNGCKGIYLDGKLQIHLSHPEDVERYRLGLIQQLKG